MQLDDLAIIKQADPEDALGVIGGSAKQLLFEPIINQYKQAGTFNNIVISGMGGSCLAGLICKNWLDGNYRLSVPLEVSRDYQLPNYVNQHTLVICLSVSGNTEETISSLHDALAKEATVTVITNGGKLLDIAQSHNLPYIQLDKISQPRYGVPMHLRAITKLLTAYQVIDDDPFIELADAHESVLDYTKQLLASVATKYNSAKQLALDCTGKTPLIYSSQFFSPLAYKWKTSFNENAKNIIWCNEFPEFNHNEFIGWTSHPIEKPFAVINLRSNLDNPRVKQRLDLTEQLLSGYRPAAHNVNLVGDNYIQQIICGAVLGDFTSIYLGLINRVDPTPVKLVEKFKKSLADL